MKRKQPADESVPTTPVVAQKRLKIGIKMNKCLSFSLNDWAVYFYTSIQRTWQTQQHSLTTDNCEHLSFASTKKRMAARHGRKTDHTLRMLSAKQQQQHHLCNVTLLPSSPSAISEGEMQLRALAYVFPCAKNSSTPTQVRWTLFPDTEITGSLGTFFLHPKTQKFGSTTYFSRKDEFNFFWRLGFKVPKMHLLFVEVDNNEFSKKICILAGLLKNGFRTKRNEFVSYPNLDTRFLHHDQNNFGLGFHRSVLSRSLKKTTPPDSNQQQRFFKLKHLLPVTMMKKANKRKPFEPADLFCSVNVYLQEKYKIFPPPPLLPSSSSSEGVVDDDEEEEKAQWLPSRGHDWPMRCANGCNNNNNLLPSTDQDCPKSLLTLAENIHFLFTKYSVLPPEQQTLSLTKIIVLLLLHYFVEDQVLPTPVLSVSTPLHPHHHHHLDTLEFKDTLFSSQEIIEHNTLKQVKRSKKKEEVGTMQAVVAGEEHDTTTKSYFSEEEEEEEEENKEKKMSDDEEVVILDRTMQQQHSGETTETEEMEDEEEEELESGNVFATTTIQQQQPPPPTVLVCV